MNDEKELLNQSVTEILGHSKLNEASSNDAKKKARTPLQLGRIFKITIPLLIVAFGLFSIIAKIVTTYNNNPMRTVIPEQINYQFEKIVRSHSNIFKEYEPDTYHGNVEVRKVVDNILSIDMRTDTPVSSEDQITLQQGRAYNFFLGHLCQSAFRNLHTLQKEFTDKYNERVDIYAEIKQLPLKGDTPVWKLLIRPVACQQSANIQ